MSVDPGAPVVGPVVNRRRLLQGAAATAATAGMVGMPAIVARAADTLTVNGYGAEYQEVFLKTVVEPFERKFSVKVTYDPTGTATENYAKIRASRGSPGFDVAGELTPPELIAGNKEKLLEPLTEKEIPNLKYVFKKSREIIPPVGIVHSFQYTALIWNTSKLDKPESWNDYWSPGQKYGDKVKGSVINFNPGNLLSVYALIMAAKLGGGGVEKMDAAWEILKKQKPYVGTVVTTSAQAAPYFENGQVWIAPYWSARSIYYRDKGHPIDLTIPKEGTIALGNCGAVPVGSKNKKLAFEFLNFRLDPDIQRNFHLGYKSSPARPDIADWPKDYADVQITTEAKMAAIEFPDSEVISAKRREWTLRWQEIMGG
jgi:putative spermidine/putrescine transport system substrate-binding protein